MEYQGHLPIHDKQNMVAGMDLHLKFRVVDMENVQTKSVHNVLHHGL
jgi:hypothetical protein